MSRSRKITERLIKEQNGLLGNVADLVKGSDVVSASENVLRAFQTGQVVVFLDPMSGLKQAGPVTVLTYDRHGYRLKVSSAVTVSSGDAIYLHGAQDESSPPKV